MELIKKQTHIDFLGKRAIALVVSGLLLIASLGSLAVKQLAFGIDFTGGVLVEVGYPENVELPQVRATLAEAGLGDGTAQHFGAASDVLIRLMPREGMDNARLGEEVLAALQAVNPDVELRRNEFVGPRVGEELREQGGLAMLFALLMILAYVTFRFQWKFALGAVAALAHDVIIVLGFFSIFGFGFDLPVLAALLAVIGYSLNDTIVVFDRIRENFHKIRKQTPEQIMNLSINQMLTRTVITSLTTLLVLAALFFIGGVVIHNFALALIVGVVLGTYSSIYVASAVALLLNVSTVDLIPEQREDRRELDAMP